MASVYYAQPLLPAIGATFRIGPGAAGLVVTAGQVGYAAGLIFLLPLGDLLERRGLVVGLSVVSAAGLIVAGLAPSIGLFYAAIAIVGLTSVVAQILVAFAATLAPDAERGRVVGSVMSGLLIGILLARTVSGYLAVALGWRGVYFAAAVLVGLQAVVLGRSLPRSRGEVRLAYPEVISSVVRLFFAEPVLRRRSLYGALLFAAFSILWTTVAFLLAGAPFHYGSGTIGLMGLVGAGGAAMAVSAGWLADRNLQATLSVVTTVLIAGSFGLLWLGERRLWVLIIGIFLLDVGCQGLHVTNQSEIYKVASSSRSRVTAAYMTCSFIGGTVGSLGAATSYDAFGWAGVCVLGAALGGVATLVALGERRFRRRTGPRTPRVPPDVGAPAAILGGDPA